MSKRYIILNVLFYANINSVASVDCWSEGKCNGSPYYVSEGLAIDASRCLQDCQYANQQGNNCTWFSYDSDNTDCYLYEDGQCESLSGERQFRSGNKNCQHAMSQIIVSSGSSQSNTIRSTEVISVNNDTNIKDVPCLKPSPVPNSVEGAIGGRLSWTRTRRWDAIFCGGQKTETFYDQCYTWDHNNFWVNSGQLPQPLAFASYGQEINEYNVFWVMGGLTSHGHVLDSTFKMYVDLLEARSSPGPTMPEALWGHSMAHVDIYDISYLISGGEKSDLTISDQLWLFNSYDDNSNFTIVPSVMTKPRKFHSSIYIKEINSVLIAGGFNGTDALKSVDILNLNDYSITKGPDLPKAIYGSKLVEYVDDVFEIYDCYQSPSKCPLRRFLIGGTNGDEIFDTIYEYVDNDWVELKEKLDEPRKNLVAFSLSNAEMPFC